MYPQPKIAKQSKAKQDERTRHSRQSGVHRMVLFLAFALFVLAQETPKPGNNRVWVSFNGVLFSCCDVT
jgi:hypothetical protein